jgi:hypothetical protein
VSFGPLIDPVRNNALLLPPGQTPSGPEGAAGLHFGMIPMGVNAPLEFLTGFTGREPNKKGRASLANPFFNDQPIGLERLMGRLFLNNLHLHFNPLSGIVCFVS